MKRRTFIKAGVTAAAIAPFGGSAAGGSAPRLRAGFARADVTTTSGPVHDPVFVKALVLDDGERRVALVSLDTICLGGGIGEVADSFFPALRERCRAFGVGEVICGTTHSHTNYSMVVGPEELLRRSAGCVEEAVRGLRPARIGAGEAHDPTWAINRSLRLRDGSRWTVRQAHPCPPDAQIEALEEYDDTVGVVRVDAADGSALATLFFFGCHPLLGYASNAASANYPGVAERLVREQTGGEAIFLQSCAGDVTEIDYKNYDRPKSCEGPGISLGLAVMKAWRAIKPADARLGFVSAPVVFPRRTDIPRRIAALKAERDRLVMEMDGCPLNFKAFLPLYMKYLVGGEYPLGYKYEYEHERKLGVTQLRDQDAINRRNIEKYLKNCERMERLSYIAAALGTYAWHEEYNRKSGSATVDGEIAGLAFGDTAILAVPVEPLSETGRKMRALSKFRHTFISGYSNGYMHYGAPASEYGNGRYETIECFLGDGWEKVALDAVADIFSRLAGSARKAGSAQ